MTGRYGCSSWRRSSVFGTSIIRTFLAIYMYQTIPDVMIADVVEPGKRVEAYGLLRIGANLGWVIGPVIGGLLLILPYQQLYTLLSVYASDVVNLSDFWIGVLFALSGAGFRLLNRLVPEKANAPQGKEKEKEKMMEAPLKA